MSRERQNRDHQSHSVARGTEEAGLDKVRSVLVLRRPPWSHEGITPRVRRAVSGSARERRECRGLGQPAWPSASPRRGCLPASPCPCRHVAHRVSKAPRHGLVPSSSVETLALLTIHSELRAGCCSRALTHYFSLCPQPLPTIWTSHSSGRWGKPHSLASRAHPIRVVDFRCFPALAS